MRAFLPPEATPLGEAIVRRNARRIRSLQEGLEGAARTGWQRRVIHALSRSLPSLRGATRRSVLHGPWMRAWIASTEDGLILSRPGADPMEIFDRVAGGPWLPRLLPRGRMDGHFPRRAAALGRQMVESSFRRLPALLAGLAPAGERLGPFPLDGEADAEEGRGRGEALLAHAGPSALRLSGPTRILCDGPDVQLISRRPPRLLPSETIPGSEILVTRRARWTRNGLASGPHVGDALVRLGEALDLVDDAWPEAGREVRAQTAVVVPLMERGTVSYSYPERPGCSYINLAGKSLVDLADDLLHESAHHRLHGLEEIVGALVDDDGEPRYWSPWRRSIRPVHGILHAAYTFTWRAGLLSRLLSSSRRLPKRWILKELGAEVEMLQRVRGDLADASGRGLLTPAGREVAAAVNRRAAEVARSHPS